MKRVLVFAVVLAAFLTIDARAGNPPQPVAEPGAAYEGQGGNAATGQDDETARADKGGQGTGSKFTAAERKTMVTSHNTARSAVGVAPVKWSRELAAYAQKWADHLAATSCTPQHRPPSGQWAALYGENVYGGKAPTAGPTEAFGMWESQKKFYQGQAVSASDLRAANYTQIVWSTTTQIGCGKAVCNGNVIVICNYDPKGNVVGQKPY